MTEVSSIMAKICNINFWIENDPPPPLGTFSKIHPFWKGNASLRSPCKEEVNYVRAHYALLGSFTVLPGGMGVG